MIPAIGDGNANEELVEVNRTISRERDDFKKKFETLEEQRTKLGESLDHSRADAKKERDIRCKLEDDIAKIRKHFGEKAMLEALK